MSCHAQKKPQLPSSPRRASGSCGLSCPVLSCVFSPGGLLIPPNDPREFFFGGGSKGSGGRGRAEGTEAKAPKMICHGLLSSLHRHGLLSSQLHHGLRCLFRSGGPRPVFLSMSVLRGLQSAPPSPVELLRRGTRLPGGESYVSPLSCVSCVPASCVHIWFVSCPRLM